MKKACVLLVFLCLLSLSPQSVRATEAPVILIMPFDNATGKQKFDSLETGLPDLLTAFLSPYNEQVMVIDRGLLENVFTENGLRWEGFTEEKSLTQLGKLAQANFIVKGSISGEDSSLGLNVFIYETETTRLLKSLESVGKADQLSGIAQKASIMIARYFETDTKEVVDLPFDEDPMRSLNYIYGLAYYHNDQSELALTYFMKILENHPDDELAHYWMGKSFLQAKMKDHAQIEFEQYLQKYPKGSRKEDVTIELNQITNKRGVVNENQKDNM